MKARKICKILDEKKWRHDDGGTIGPIMATAPIFKFIRMID